MFTNNYYLSDFRLNMINFSNIILLRSAMRKSFRSNQNLHNITFIYLKYHYSKYYK